MKHGDHALLQGWSHINENVAATDKVHPGKGRVIKDILGGENAHVPDRLADLVALFGLVEEASQARGGYIGADAVLVDPSSRPLDGGFAEIRSKDLNGQRGSHVAEMLDQRDGMGVSFFSG